MRIKKVACGDNILEGRFEAIYFFHLGLLPGIYGVGKTQISKVILRAL
ncbi:hypothetical protein [Microcoleus sp. K5-D4]